MFFLINFKDPADLKGQDCFESKRNLAMQNIEHDCIRSILSDLQLIIRELHYNWLVFGWEQVDNLRVQSQYYVLFQTWIILSVIRVSFVMDFRFKLYALIEIAVWNDFYDDQR